MRVCLFEDRVESLEPLTLTRPVFELWCGQTNLAAKHLRHFAPCDVGVLIRPHLTDIYRLQHPSVPVNDALWLRSEPAILVNGRWLPPAQPALTHNGPAVGLVDGDVAYAVLNPDR